MAEWKKSQYKGLRYRESDTEFVGVGRSKRPRRYFMMVYKWQGKSFAEALGWEDDIVLDKALDEERAYDIFRRLSANRKDNTHPFTLAEYREINEAKLKADELAAQEAKLRNITFGEVFLDHYFPQIQHNLRNDRSIQRESALFRLWIAPVLGHLSIRDVMPLHLERVKKNMLKVGRSAGSIRYCLAVVRQVFNFALRNNLFTGRNPADKSGGVKRPSVDNRRTRFLTRQEASDLLDELAKISSDVRDMVLFSLHTRGASG